MAFVSIDNFKNKTTKHGTPKVKRSNLCKMTVHSSKYKINPDNITYSLCITVSEDVMKKSRMIIGDRAEVLFDDKDQTLVMVRRVQHGGHAISNSTRPVQETVGKCMRGNIRFTLPEKLPFSHGDAFVEKELQITQDGIVIKFEKVSSADLFN